MKILTVTDRNQLLIKQLTSIWESAVRATHDFLTEADIQNFKKELPNFLEQVPELAVVFEYDRPVAFIGCADSTIEMLFVDDKKRGHGYGQKLIDFALKNFDADRLTVNEQNPQAIGFYQHMGFETYRRTETDEAGHPFPLLYMKLKK